MRVLLVTEDGLLRRNVKIDPEAHEWPGNSCVIFVGIVNDMYNEEIDPEDEPHWFWMDVPNKPGAVDELVEYLIAYRALALRRCRAEESER